MKQLELRYVAHVTTLTNCLLEHYQTTACSIRELVAALDGAYPGFQDMFVNPQTETLQLNAMIYCAAPGEVPASVIDLEHPVKDGGVVTFW